MVGWTRVDQRTRRVRISDTLLLLNLGLGSPLSLQAQKLQMSAAAGWVDPGDWPRVFGGTGPAFRLALSRQVTDRFSVHGRFTSERLRTVTIDEPSYLDDLPPFDQPVPNGRRGTSMWEGQVGLGLSLMPNAARWHVESTIGTGITTLDPDGRTIFPSPSERRWGCYARVGRGEAPRRGLVGHHHTRDPPDPRHRPDGTERLGGEPLRPPGTPPPSRRLPVDRRAVHRTPQGRRDLLNPSPRPGPLGDATRRPIRTSNWTSAGDWNPGPLDTYVEVGSA